MLSECEEMSTGGLSRFPMLNYGHADHGRYKTKHIGQQGCGLFLHSQPPNPGCVPVYEPIQE